MDFSFLEGIPYLCLPSLLIKKLCGMGGLLAKADASADVLNNLKKLTGIEKGGVVGIEPGGVVGIESGGVSINTGGVSILVIAVVVVILFFILIMYLIWNHMKEMRLVENALPLRDKVF